MSGKMDPGEESARNGSRSMIPQPPIIDERHFGSGLGNGTIAIDPDAARPEQTAERVRLDRIAKVAGASMDKYSKARARRH